MVAWFLLCAEKYEYISQKNEVKKNLRHFKIDYNFLKASNYAFIIYNFSDLFNEIIGIYESRMCTEIYPIYQNQI